MATPETTKNKRKPNWNDDEVKVLLRVWKDYYRKLTTIKRNQFLYEDMSKEMESYGVIRDAPDVRCKIKNLTKMFKIEKAQEFVDGTPSKWRFCSKINEILGADVNFMGYLRDNSTRCEETPVKKFKVESGQATILRLGWPQKSQSNETEDEDDEDEQPHIYNESAGNSLDAMDSQWERRKGEDNFLEELYRDYQETKQGLVDTDKQILELLANQNDLIKTQNDLCRTQNAILTSLLDKMK